jgi:hypothetical protein
MRDNFDSYILDDTEFMEIITKIDSKITKINILINEETLLGSFYNLKTYI